MDRPPSNFLKFGVWWGGLRLPIKYVNPFFAGDPQSTLGCSVGRTPFWNGRRDSHEMFWEQISLTVCPSTKFHVDYLHSQRPSLQIDFREAARQRSFSNASYDRHQIQQLRVTELYTPTKFRVYISHVFERHSSHALVSCQFQVTGKKCMDTNAALNSQQNYLSTSKSVI